MALFDVPGWTVPAAPVVEQPQRKRKRPSAQSGEDGAKVETPTINFEKLMEKLEAGNAAQRPSKRQRKDAQKKQGQQERAAEREGGGAGAPRGPANDADRAKHQGKGKGKEKGRSDAAEKGKKAKGPAVASSSPSEGDARASKSKKRQKKGKSNERADSSAPTAGGSKKADAGQSSNDAQNLTALQAGLKNSLDGARFRWINEVLYKSESSEAHKMMKENPAVFDEYHTGFRHQVHSWPTNPVSHYIDVLSSYPAKTVIADLGCGDAALARDLVPRGMTVLSFDLVSDGIYIVEADTCSRLPLPGSDSVSGGEGEGGVVDVVVCALSLMGTNWPKCIREAWRVLRPGGELKIAEVASRFTDISDFVSLVSAFGFRLKSKDDRNTHFTLFDFVKVARKAKGEKEWEKLLARGAILKPCEYKRR
ncbi:hypothetical protein WOLCODRAFT_131836 [Wolfiporia cocos MD-104 SS10]|uniref:Ribosomal RNA-processing protein 8 n=1 Tax=Wolfiporia cocos (strain MD-104) TaxID=742152 RepID=A0A2H3JGI7_WOLCO|nr:hypothetical protein WOLCODRAFT_131836 [Wolfiporia cocos MD-104 SS10]